MCGGVNSGIVKEIKSIVKVDRDSYRIFSIGEKGSSGLTRPCPDLLVRSVAEVALPLSFSNVSAIAHHMCLEADEFD